MTAQSTESHEVVAPGDLKPLATANRLCCSGGAATRSGAHQDRDQECDSRASKEVGGAGDGFRNNRQPLGAD